MKQTLGIVATLISTTNDDTGKIKTAEDAIQIDLVVVEDVASGRETNTMVFGSEILSASYMQRKVEIDSWRSVAGYLDETLEQQMPVWAKLVVAAIAAEDGKPELFEALLEAVPDLDQADEQGRTVLMFTAGPPLLRHSHFEGNSRFINVRLVPLRILLDNNKASVDAQDENGRTALMHATMARHEGAVRMLLGAKADINLRDKGGWNALNLLVEDSSAEDVSEPVLRLLLDTGIQINVLGKGKDTMTPLIAAGFWGHTTATRTLLDAGAKVDFKNDQGSVAFIYAALRGHVGVVKALLDAGADVNAATNHGRTALMESARGAGGKLEVMKILLDAVADASLCCKSGKTALIVAEEWGHMACHTLLKGI
jgi:ankyrin repeat protein